MGEFVSVSTSTIKKFNDFKDILKISESMHYYCDEIKNDLITILDIFNSTDIDLDNLNQYEWDYKNPNIILYLGLYYQYIKNEYEKMMICYDKNIQINSNSNSMIQYGIYYENIEKNKELAIEYYKMSIKYSNSFGYYKLAKIINSDNIDIIDEEAKEYYIKGMYMGNKACFLALIHYYLVKLKDYDNAIKYMDLFFESQDDKEDVAIGIYSIMLKFGEYDIGIKYLVQLSNMGYQNSKLLLAEFFLDVVENNEEGTKLLLELAEQGNFTAFEILKDKICSNELQFYFWLKRLEFNNEVKQMIIDSYESSNMVKDYKKKLEENKTNTMECFICCNQRIMLKFSCGHDICERCYVNMNQCYYKCNHTHIESYNLENEQIFDNILQNLKQQEQLEQQEQQK